MMLVLSILLGIVPLFGIAWTVKNSFVTTVDGLFLCLILLTLSGIMFLNVFLELRKRRNNSPAPTGQKPS
jgi:hypothetical protein